MAWQSCGRHLMQRILQLKSAASPLVASEWCSIPKRRHLHSRLQSVWDSAKSNVARVPSLLPSRARTQLSFCKKFTAVVVLGGGGIGGLSVYDDYIIFQQCGKRALNKANADPELKAILGENIEQGPWYEASMKVDHEGHSTAVSFPVTGTLASASLHLRAVRYEGEWELLVLEALIHRPDPGGPSHVDNLQRIDLLRTDSFGAICGK